MIPTDADTATDLSLRALNLVNSGIIVLDVHHKIVLWNSWMVPRSARAAARVRERSLFEVFPELRGSRVEAAVLAALAPTPYARFGDMLFAVLLGAAALGAFVLARKESR